MRRAPLIALGLALAAALPARAADESYSLMGQATMAFQSVVTDTDTGNRARVRYFPDVPAMGWDRIVDENGVEQDIEWFGNKAVFEVEFGIAGGFVPQDAAAFVRDAVLAVCPSAGAAQVTTAPFSPTGSPTLFTLDAICPEAGR